MILDENEFKASIEVGSMLGFELETYFEWAAENGTVINYAFGRLYFKEPEFAVLFRLQFGL
jgi:hypothetical protein